MKMSTGRRMKKVYKHKKRYYYKSSPMVTEEFLQDYLKTRELKFEQMRQYAPKSVNIVRQEILPAASLPADRVISLDSDMQLDGVNLTKKKKRHIVQHFPATTNASGNNDRLVIELNDYLTLTKTKNVGKFNLKPIPSKCDKVNPLSPIEKIIKNANAVSLDRVLKGKPSTKTMVDNSDSESQRTFLLVPENAADSVNKTSKLDQSQTVLIPQKTADSVNKTYKPDLKRLVLIPQETVDSVIKNPQFNQNRLVMIPQKTADSVNKDRKINQNRLVLIPQKTAESVNPKPKLSQNQMVLIPQRTADSLDKKLQSDPKPIIEKKSKTQPTTKSSDPVKVLQNLGQINPVNSSSQLSNILEGSNNFFIKIPVTNHQETNPQLSEKSANRLTKAMKKIQRDHARSVAKKTTDSSKKGKTKLNVVLRAHPYFSKHKPFIIKHKPVEAEVTKHQSYALKSQQGNLLNPEFSVVSISEPSKSVDEVKYEMPEEDVSFVVPEESESINPVFPVALKSTDSDYFEYLTLEDNNEILTGTDLQILGI